MTVTPRASAACTVWNEPPLARDSTTTTTSARAARMRLRAGNRQPSGRAPSGVPVMAVPGPVRSPFSCYTNELLVSGSAPARDVDDVLVALELLGRGPARPRRSRSSDLPVAPDDPDQVALLEAMGW